MGLLQSILFTFQNLICIYFAVGLPIHELLNRWTDIFILPRTARVGPFNPYNTTQTHSIFVKL